MTAAEPALPLCGTCRHRLGVDELATCRACVADVRANLAVVVDLYGGLLAHLGHLGSNAPDPGRPGRSSGLPLPGGTVLVLLGPGAPAPADADALPADPPSVAGVLARHEDDWRRRRREPAADELPNVAYAADYLRARLPWAASRHPGFPGFALDVHRLRSRLESATGLAEHPERAGIPCFDCGGDLERRYTDSGRDDDWTCARCRRVYDQAAYLLAVRASLEDARP